MLRKSTKTKRTLPLLRGATERPDAHCSLSTVLEFDWDKLDQHKGSPEQEKFRRRKLSHTVRGLKLCNLQKRDVQQHVDERWETVGVAIARLEVMHIRAVSKHAQADTPKGLG